MAWTNKKGFNFRSTLGYVTDGAGEAFVNSTSGNILAYPQSMTMDGDTFNVGWNVGGADGTRDRSTSVGPRLAGMAGIFNPGTKGTFRINAGTAAGRYKIWLGGSSQTGSVSGPLSFALRDSNGTLTSWSGVGSLGSTDVVDITGVTYASAAAWAAAADGAGVAITVTTTDTSNGAGGPVFYFDMGTTSQYTPLSHIAIQYLGAAGPTLSTISTSALKYLDTGITLTGSGFGATKGSSSVIISPTNNPADANAVTQTTTAWSDTSITFTVGRGALKYAASGYYVFVRTSGGDSTGQAVSLSPQTGWAYAGIVTPDPTASNRITATADIASGDQLAYGNIQGTGTVVVTSSATFNATSTVTAFDVEVNDGIGWGTTATQTLSAGQPTYDGQDIIQVRSFTVRGRFT